MVVIKEEVSTENRLSDRESSGPTSPSSEWDDLGLRSGLEGVTSVLDKEDLRLIRAFYFILSRIS